MFARHRSDGCVTGFQQEVLTLPLCPVLDPGRIAVFIASEQGSDAVEQVLLAGVPIGMGADRHDLAGTLVFGPALDGALNNPGPVGIGMIGHVDGTTGNLHVLAIARFINPAVARGVVSSLIRLLFRHGITI